MTVLYSPGYFYKKNTLPHLFWTYSGDGEVNIIRGIIKSFDLGGPIIIMAMGT